AANPRAREDGQGRAGNERRGRDSNPRWRFTPHTHLAGGRLKPLGHLSGYGARTAQRRRARSVRYRLMWRRVLVVWSASRLAVLSLGLLLTTQLGWPRAPGPWEHKVLP